MNSKLSLCVIWCLMVTGIHIAHAYQVNAGDLTDLSIEDLMTVEVTTVSRKSKPLADTPAAAFVITADDIRRSGVTSIPEALRMVPGIEVARINANIWAITARGFNGRFANKLLVLMDGRTVYSPTYSGVYWDVQDTLLEDIARIEVIRGPGASLWGANAVNGVINIITRPAAETQAGLVAGGVGTEEKSFGALRYGGAVGTAGQYRAYVKYFDRDASHSPDGTDAQDNWQVASGGGRIDWQPSERDALTVQGDLYDGEASSRINNPIFEPPYNEVFIDSTPISGGNVIGRWQRTFSDSSDFILQTYYDYTKRGLTYLKEARDTLDLDFQHRFVPGRRQEILWGLGYRYTRAAFDDSIAADFKYLDRWDQLFSMFIQDEIAVVPDRLSLTIGSKFEHNDYTGFEVQPNLRLLWQPDSRNSYWAAVSRAVRTPAQAEYDVTFVRTVLPTTPPSIVALQGQDDYQSEELMAYEAGYRYYPAEHFSVDLAIFYNQYDRLRTAEQAMPYPADPPTFVMIPFVVGNLMEGQTYGAELALDYRPLAWWRLQAAYTCLMMDLKLKADSLDPASTRAEDEVPQHQVSLRSTMDLLDNWQLDLWGRYVDALPALEIPAYWTLDARLGWQPTENLTLSLVGQNLLDASHPEYNGEFLSLYSVEIERGVYIKAEWRF